MSDDESIYELSKGAPPTVRILSLLEVIASKDEFVTLHGLVAETGIPKPTLHRMLHQLEAAGMLQREADGRQFSTGARLRKLAENVLLNNTAYGARHAVLQGLVDAVGETCNITALSGSEVLYLDRVETPAPLRVFLQPGSRVPVHCSASGKLFLAQMSSEQRGKILKYIPLTAHTEHTLTERDELEQELTQIQRQGYALDQEEFLPGLFCVAMIVPSKVGRSNTGIAIQAPAMRLSVRRVEEVLPAMREAATKLAEIEDRAAALTD